MAATKEDRLPVDVSDEPLIGWRCWHVLLHEGLLRPIFKRGLVWKPRQPHEAVCPDHPHEVPADHCKCGVWTVCHPLLLDEIGWQVVPPQGISKLPGVLVVGEVSLWGKIIQHERGWRAGYAYPRHLYVFTDDAMLAETLRERYGVPVTWGSDAERLRRLLPPQQAEEEEEPETNLREMLLDVLRTGLCPKPLEELTAEALNSWSGPGQVEAGISEPPEARLTRAHAEYAKATGDARCLEGWYAALAAAEIRALDGDSLAARRALWVRLVVWQRDRAEKLFNEEIKPTLGNRDEVLEDLHRATHPRTGKPYATSTLYTKHVWLRTLDEYRIPEAVSKVEKLMVVPIPTYREWCGLAQGVVVGRSAPPSATLSGEQLSVWHRRAVKREEDLAERARELALQRHQFVREQEALDAERVVFDREVEEGRKALEQERVQLRDDVLTSIERDRAELLQEIRDLDHRRRAALAMLGDPWPPQERRPYAPLPRVMALPSPGEPAGRPLVAKPQPELSARLVALGITHARVAELAGCSRAKVSFILTGRVRKHSPQVLEAAQRLIAKAEADLVAREARQEPGLPNPAPVGESRTLGIGHPALTERLRLAGITCDHVAQAIGCSRALVSHVLSAKLAGRRGKAKLVVQTAERLLAEATGRAVEPPAAPEAPGSLAAIREALLRERAELDKVRHQMLLERASAEAARRAVEQERRRLAIEARDVARMAEVARARHVAAGLRHRLAKAGISHTQLAKAAKRSVGQVSHLLAGKGSSRHLVSVAERLLAKGRK